MITTKAKNPKAVQMYDRVKVREYFKIMGGFIVSWQELLRTDVLETTTVLEISAAKLPDEVYINGKRYDLISHPLT